MGAGVARIFYQVHYGARYKFHARFFRAFLFNYQMSNSAADLGCKNNHRK
jgi:hypothetical protein